MENNLPAGSVPLAETIGLQQQEPGTQAAWQPHPAIEIELPNGTKIGMATPKVSLARFVGGVLQDMKFTDPTAQEMERKRVECLLHITDINGEAQVKIGTPIARAALEQKIGYEFIDPLIEIWAVNFPPVDPGILKVTKK